MKKFIAVLGLVATTVAANAQEPTRHGKFKHNRNQESFKPLAGDFTGELGLSGGILNSEVNLNENGLLRFRYFVKDDLAIRLGASVGANNRKENAYGINNEAGWVKQNNFGVGINLGIEKHFAGTKRLSPYVGADLMFNATSNHKWSEKANYAGAYDANYSFDVKGANQTGFGVRAIMGADYYFAKNVYLGVEAGLGFMASKSGKTTTTNVDNGVTKTFTTESRGSTFELSPNVITGVRIGFVF